METLLTSLLHLLRKKSYQFRLTPLFTLASGNKSPYYIDCKATMHDPEGKALIGEIFFEKIKNLKIDAIGGLTMGADPIAISTSLISYQKGVPIKSFSVRKEVKGHGTAKRVEGEVQPGNRVIIVDDVITTGKSVIEAIEAAQDFGLEIVKVIVLVDRQEERGFDKIKAGIPDTEAIFTLTDLKDLKAHARDSQTRVASAADRKPYQALRSYI